MNSETIEYIAYACFALAGIFLALSIYLFFFLKIKQTIYELSGKAKTDTTRSMVEGYAQTGSLRHSGLTDTLATSAEIDISNSLMFTDGLSGGRKTSQKISQSQRTASGGASSKPASGGLKLVKDVIVIHTDERIN